MDFSSIKDFLHAVVSGSPIIAAITSPSRRIEDGGLMRQIIVAMFIPIITAGITALVTAYVTQAVMREEIIQIKQEMALLRDTERQDYQRMEDWIIQYQRGREDKK